MGRYMTDLVSASSASDADLMVINQSGDKKISFGAIKTSVAHLSGSANTGAVRYSGSVKTDGAFYGGVSDPTTSTRLNYDGDFHATKIYNAVYNDFADFQKMSDAKEKVLPGFAYYHNGEGITLCVKRCQKSFVGIASDTFGISVGKVEKTSQIPLAVAGWVLAQVDKVYESGTALVNDKNGVLTKARLYEKILFPERIAAIYQKSEAEKTWNKIKVNGRHWVKVK